MAPTGTIKKNRAHSISICRKEWPDVKPKEQKLDCDEFPFASTKEGSLPVRGNFSVRYINASDNRSSGSQLGVFYQQTRRLGIDPSGSPPTHAPRTVTSLRSADD
ncbi:NucA/NucB deoxyribonuclease domain-containing protein [Herbidospora mongoliensis]|uniref:NucA/NucB deoxyribonuclease domain-containing protein n=1 Tax=Herbidospora mongoliensis TaxID=688067 RepID=UPI0008322FA4|nr:NucA/NucB deoxyribonuclease domain-containing protein [Herbidospora mongoliensis]